MPDLLQLIQDRKSTRGPYDPKRSIPRQDMIQILEVARWAPTAHNMQNFEIMVVDDKKLLKAIGDIKGPMSEIFIRENYQQLSSSEEELLQKKVGVLATMFPPFMRNPVGKMDVEAGEQRAHFRVD